MAGRGEFPGTALVRLSLVPAGRARTLRRARVRHPGPWNHAQPAAGRSNPSGARAGTRQVQGADEKRPPWTKRGPRRSQQGRQAGPVVASVTFPPPPLACFRSFLLRDPQGKRPLRSRLLVLGAGANGGLRSRVTRARFRTLSPLLVGSAPSLVRLRSPGSWHGVLASQEEEGVPLPWTGVFGISTRSDGDGGASRVFCLDEAATRARTARCARARLPCLGGVTASIRPSPVLNQALGLRSLEAPRRADAIGELALDDALDQRAGAVSPSSAAPVTRDILRANADSFPGPFF